MKTGAFGASQHAASRTLRLHSGLIKATNQVINEEQQKLKAARIAKAAEPIKSRAPKGKALLTEAEVLECRTLHEFHGWGRRALARRYPKASDDYLRKLLDYEIRAQLHLDPRHVGPVPID